MSIISALGNDAWSLRLFWKSTGAFKTPIKTLSLGIPKPTHQPVSQTNGPATVHDCSSHRVPTPWLWSEWAITCQWWTFLWLCGKLTWSPLCARSASHTLCLSTWREQSAQTGSRVWLRANRSSRSSWARCRSTARWCKLKLGRGAKSVELCWSRSLIQFHLLFCPKKT